MAAVLREPGEGAMGSQEAQPLLGAAEGAGVGREAPAAEGCLLGGIYHPKRVLGTMEGWCWFYLGR